LAHYCYIRVLQYSERARLDEVPPDKRAELDKTPPRRYPWSAAAMNPSEPITVRISQWQRTALLAGIGGVLLTITGLLLDREQLLRSYLFAYVYWTVWDSDAWASCC